MKPKEHQQKFIDENPNKAILAWEMRVGKSLPGAIWIDHPCRAGNTYIITPKQNKQDWINFKTKATVLTKEEFKKIAHTIKDPTAILVDEIHYFASPLFIKGRSQMATALYNLIKKYPRCHFLGLTATPIRQNAWSLHTLLCYIGIYYSWKEWREEFFEKKAMRFLTRPSWMPKNEIPMAWMPREDWRIRVRYYLEKHCNILSLKDIIKDLPPPIYQDIRIRHPKYHKPEDRVVTWIDEHKYEQQGKAEEILKLGFKKLIVVAQYTDQIDELSKKLSEEKPVFVLDGRTKNADETKRLAKEADECYFIVQSSMGFGFDGYMFGAIVFASMSHSCLHHTQMTGRLRNIEHLNPCFYFYLIGGRWDRRIKETIEMGKDFNPHDYRFDDENDII